MLARGCSMLEQGLQYLALHPHAVWHDDRRSNNIYLAQTMTVTIE